MEIIRFLPGRIETANLRLRRPIAADVISLSSLWKNEKIRQFLGGVVSDEVIHKKISSLQDHWKQHGFGQWVVCKKNEEVIGLCGLHYSEDGIEISYMFFPLFWGRGWAYEAAFASLDFGFNVLELSSIIAITQEANQKSCRLLEKIGMNHINNFWRFTANQRWYELTHSEWMIKNRALS